MSCSKINFPEDVVRSLLSAEIISAIKNKDISKLANQISFIKEKYNNINLKCPQGVTALHYTVLFDFTEGAKYLIRHGANVNAIDSESNTPLHYALGQEGKTNTGIVQLLVDAKSDVNAIDDMGQTPLITLYNIHATKSVEVSAWVDEVTNILIDAGANLEAIDNNRMNYYEYIGAEVDTVPKSPIVAKPNYNSNSGSGSGQPETSISGSEKANKKRKASPPKTEVYDSSAEKKSKSEKPAKSPPSSP